jgi:hypothetical protein
VRQRSDLTCTLPKLNIVAVNNLLCMVHGLSIIAAFECCQGLHGPWRRERWLGKHAGLHRHVILDDDYLATTGFWQCAGSNSVAHHGHDGDLHGLSLRYRWRSNWFNVGSGRYRRSAGFDRRQLPRMPAVLDGEHATSSFPGQTAFRLSYGRCRLS